MDEPQLALDESDSGPAHVVAARGEIHLSTAPQLAERLAAAVDAGHIHIVVDLSDVEFIDSTGLSVLLNLLRRLDPLQGRMVIACTNPTVLRLFEITRLEETLDIVASRADAVARIQDADSSAGAP